METSKKANKRLRARVKQRKKQKEVEESNQNEPPEEFPIDHKNEQLLLGYAIKDYGLLRELTTYTKPECFLIENHQVIAWILGKMFDEGIQQTPDMFEVMKNEYPGKSKKYGGMGYISTLIESYTDKLNVPTYQKHIEKLKTDYAKHEISENHLPELLKLINNPYADLTSVLEKINNMNEATLDSYNADSRGFQTMKQLNKDHDREIELRNSGDNFVSTGYDYLDQFLTDGYARGKVSIYGGRPGMGKSAMVANSMNRLMNRPDAIPCALFSLEMDSISMLDRLNAIYTSIPVLKLVKNRDMLTDIEIELEKNAKKKREGKPIFICDDARKSLPEIRRELKTLIDKHGVRVCFIDLFMKVTKISGFGNKSTADQYTEMLNEVQRIAKELNVHIVLVVQIGRKVEARRDKKPTMSDLKDSGAFEEIADNIFLFYRPEYYKKKQAEKMGEDQGEEEFQIIIAKQRQGLTATVSMIYVPETTRILPPKSSSLGKVTHTMTKGRRKTLTAMSKNRAKKAIKKSNGHRKFKAKS